MERQKNGSRKTEIGIIITLKKASKNLGKKLGNFSSRTSRELKIINNLEKGMEVSIS